MPARGHSLSRLGERTKVAAGRLAVVTYAPATSLWGVLHMSAVHSRSKRSPDRLCARTRVAAMRAARGGDMHSHLAACWSASIPGVLA